MASDNGDQAGHPWRPPVQPGSPDQPQQAQPGYPLSGPPGSPPYQPGAHPGGPQPQQPQQPQGYGQPLYQQPPYSAPPQGYGQYGAPFGQQPYPPGPPKKRRVRLWFGLAVVVVLAVLAGVAFLAKPGFLGFKKTLDHTSVEQHIEKFTGYTHVLCNSGKNPTVKKGKTFTCTADGGKTITVTITNSDGSYGFALPS